MSTDPNDYRASAIESPALDMFAIAQNNGANLAVYTSYLYIETGGFVHFETVAGTELTVDFDRGYHPLRVRKVFSAGTTAAGIYGLIQADHNAVVAAEAA